MHQHHAIVLHEGEVGAGRPSVEVVFMDGKTERLFVLEGDHISRVMKNSGRYYEHDLLVHLHKRAPKGVYLDIGAFIGTHALCFARHFPATRVLAIEPERVSYDILCQNAALMPHQVVVLRAGCGSGRYAHGTVVRPVPHNAGMNRIVACAAAPQVGDVRMVTVDALRAGMGPDPVALIKVDVEGMEGEILDGTRQTLVQDRPVVVVEAITARNKQGVDRALRGLGYTPEGPFCATPTYIYWPKI